MNPRPLAYEANALTTELSWQKMLRRLELHQGSPAYGAGEVLLLHGAILILKLKKIKVKPVPSLILPLLHPPPLENPHLNPSPPLCGGGGN